MHEPVTKRRPMIDMEEFERRLRQQSSGDQTEDDLFAELDRLIGGQQDSFQRVTEPQCQRSTEARQDTLESGERKRPDAMERFNGGDFGSTEAGLLGATRRIAVATSSEAQEPEAQESYALPSLDDTTACQDFGAVNDEIRSRHPLYVLAAIVIVGMAGIAASFGFRSWASRPPEIATISENGSAEPQLKKISHSDVPTPDASILGAAPQPSPVVHNAEQPVDLLQARDTMPAIVAEDRSSTVRPDSGLAIEVARIAASPEQIETQAEPPSETAPLEPKKMNTASVGQHDAILSGDTPPRAAAIVPMPVPRPAAVAKVSNRKRAARVARPKAGDKLKRSGSTVTAQPMQTTSRGEGRDPDPLGDLLRGLFGGP